MKFFSGGMLVLALAVGLMAALPGNVKNPQVFVSSFENVLGTSFDLKVWTDDEQKAEEAEHAALAEIDRLSAILSSYDKGSEFSRWASTLNEDVKVSGELYHVLQAFDQWKLATGGALDPAAGALIQVWKDAEKRQIFPTADELRSVTADINQQHWQLDPSAQTARHLTTIPLVMNSFVKSYILQSALDKVMAIQGIRSALINIGGDIMIRGNEMEWITIADPAADNQPGISKVQLANRAIATSGNYKRGYNILGQKFSHILDPRTGMPSQGIVSATVMAPDAELAGALATAFNVMTPEASAQLARSKGNVDYLIVTADGRTIASEGWPFNEEKKAGSLHNSVGQKPWNNGYELAVNLELMKFEGRSRRPFVAVWVEDKDKKTVKTLALWFNKPRWLPDLKEWFRKNSDTYQNGSKDVFSIGTATRPAGVYTIKWDGKNEEGNPVPEGNYTVYIEVAREHGTYQIMKQEVSCKNKPQQYSWPANPEVAAASVEYRKLTN